MPHRLRAKLLKRRIILFGVVAALFLGLIYSGNIGRIPKGVSSPTSLKADASVPEQKAYWGYQIDKLGGETSYQHFKQWAAEMPILSQHPTAHIFGELLYQKTGLDGITVCDSNFAFGCYHSFFISAVTDKGTGIVSSLDASCIKKFGPLGTGCQHGIGHGLMEFLTVDKLNQALDLCAPIQRFILLGCVSGVFMEYNFPTIIRPSSTVTTSRNFNSAFPYHPCDLVLMNYKPSCYFEISPWWYSLLKKDTAQVANLCTSLADPTDKKYCLLGFGNILGATNDYDYTKAVPVCGALSNISDKTSCLAGVAWSLYAEPSKKSIYTKPCDDLDLTLKQSCLSQADLTKATY